MAPMEMVIALIIPSILLVISAGIAIYIILLLSRLVRAVEKIAAALDNKSDA
jgi:hypothetical protein